MKNKLKKKKKEITSRVYHTNKKKSYKRLLAYKLNVRMEYT